jgi:hypothetical protein
MVDQIVDLVDIPCVVDALRGVFYRKPRFQ